MLFGLAPRIPAHQTLSRLFHSGLPDGVDQSQHGSLALDALFEKSGSRFTKLPMSFGPLTKFFDIALRDRPQPCFAFDVGGEDDRLVPFALGASAGGLGAFSLQSIDRPSDQRMI